MKKLSTLTIIFLSAISYTFSQNTFPNSGNVGIGTMSPGSALEVGGSADIDSTLTTDSLNAANGADVGRMVVQEDLKVKGKAVFKNKLVADSTAKFREKVVINGKLVADSTAKFKDKVVVEGKTVMKGDAKVEGKSTLFGNVEMQQTLTINGNTQVNGTFSLPNLTMGGNPKLLLIDSIGNIQQGPDFDVDIDSTCIGTVLPWGEKDGASNTIALCGYEKIEVGLSSTNSGAKLNVGGNGLFDGKMTIGAKQANNNAWLHVTTTDTAENARVAEFQAINGRRIYMVPKLSGLGFNPLSQQGDMGIFWSDDPNGTGPNQNAGFVLGEFGGPIGMRIGKDGKVGIGVTNPQYTLDVDGLIRGCDLRAEASNWCDFVYEENYDLMPIEELKSFTTKQKHMPNLQPESYYYKNGIKISEIVPQLVKNDEEAVLYIIQLDEKMHQMEQRMAQLEQQNKELQQALKQNK